MHVCSYLLEQLVHGQQNVCVLKVSLVFVIISFSVARKSCTDIYIACCRRKELLSSLVIKLVCRVSLPPCCLPAVQCSKKQCGSPQLDQSKETEKVSVSPAVPYEFFSDSHADEYEN